jgi:hypothetical protein
MTSRTPTGGPTEHPREICTFVQRWEAAAEPVMLDSQIEGFDALG